VTVYSEKDRKKYDFIKEWKSEGVTDDESGDGEIDQSGED